MKSVQYVGRFAPSPTGKLHFGSLLAAMASYCDARCCNGLWRLRIDNIDPPREMSGAANHIQQTLADYGFKWDGPVIYQSQQTQHYRDKLTQLNKLSVLFPCDCSRAKLANQPVYPGHCNPLVGASSCSVQSASNMVSDKLSNGNENHAIRLIIDTHVVFEDSIQGPQVFDDGYPGDTIVVRRDDLFSYALACAVDDANGINHVVRGCDLLPTTASQLSIIDRLELPAPRYAHIPVAVNSEQQKLSKQTHASPINAMPTLETLRLAWRFLGQSDITANNVQAFWHAAIPAWRLANVPRQSHLDTPV